MANFYDTQLRGLESRIVPSTLSRYKHQFNINPETREKIYIMLSNGNINPVPCNSETPFIHSPKFFQSVDSPNQRLINQIAKTLTELKVNFDRPLLSIGAGKHRIISIRKDPFNVVMIYSWPTNGLSYVMIQHVGKDSQLRYDILANTPLKVIKRLILSKVIVCPKSHTCHVVCPDCPEL